MRNRVGGEGNQDHTGSKKQWCEGLGRQELQGIGGKVSPNLAANPIPGGESGMYSGAVSLLLVTYSDLPRASNPISFIQKLQFFYPKTGNSSYWRTARAEQRRVQSRTTQKQTMVSRPGESQWAEDFLVQDAEGGAELRQEPSSIMGRRWVSICLQLLHIGSLWNLTNCFIFTTNQTSEKARFSFLFWGFLQNLIGHLF